MQKTHEIKSIVSPKPLPSQTLFSFSPLSLERVPKGRERFGEGLGVRSMFHRQLHDSQLAKNNYEALKTCRKKTFDFDLFHINVHFNPARAVSSLAKLDKKTIEARPCFLCATNRPKEQEKLDFKGKYEILVNPFPICPIHFTIASYTHEPQLIAGKLDDMLDLSQALPDFAILYNGAKAGASAPDHFHFQAVNLDFFSEPIEKPMKGLIGKISFHSSKKEDVINWFESIYEKLKTDEDEPMMNIFCQYKSNEWILTIFPRKRHRPAQFFAEGSEQIMISPGAIDMTGNIITAREIDFEKITKEVLVDVFEQISE